MKKKALIFNILFSVLCASPCWPAFADLGDYSEDASLSFMWATYDSNGGSITRSGDGSIWVWKDATTTSTAGITNTEDFNGMVGVHKCVVDLSADVFYQTGADYQVTVRDATVDTRSYNAVIAGFSIENRFMRGSDSTVSGAAKRPASSYVLSVGTQSANTFASTEELDGVRHEHTDTAGSMDLYYEFDIGSGLANEVKLTGYLQGNNDDLEVYGYDWVSDSWKQIGVMTGLNSSVNVARTYDLLFNMVGSDSDEGKVRVRLTDGAFTLTSALLAIDQILVEFSQGVEGYQNAAVWLDTSASNTNTIRGVDGTATNPVSTIAAVNALLASTNLQSIEVAPNSSITFASSQENQKFVGRNWTLALGGQSISGSFIEGANVTGIATGATPPHFDHCHFGSVTLPPSDSESCVLQGTFTLGSAGDFFFEDCKSGVAGTNTPVLDFGAGLAASSINMRAWSGGIEIENMGAGAGSYNMSLEGWGQFKIAASCSADSTVAIRGSFTVTDNAGGAVTLSDDARFDITQTQYADVREWAGTAVAAPSVAGVPEVDVTHIAGNSGAANSLKSLTDMIVASGTAQGPGVNSNQIQLAAGEPSSSGIFDPSLILLTGGLGAGQSRRIIEYDGSTKIAVVSRTWKIVPDSSTEYAIFADPGGLHVNEGLIVAGGTTTATLNALASSVDDAYIYQTIFIVSGAGEDQSRIVTGYVGSSQMITIDRPWDISLDGTSGYLMLPIGTSNMVIADIKAVTDLLPDAGALTTIATDTARLTAARAATMTDWIDDGRLDLILDSAATSAALSTAQATLDAYLPYIPGHTGAVFYVDANSGNDSNDGLSFSAAKLTITAGIAAASAGDMVRVGVGDYEETDLEIPVGKDGLSLIGSPGVLLSGALSTTNVLLVAAPWCLVSDFRIVFGTGLNGVHVTGANNTIKNISGFSATTMFYINGNGCTLVNCTAKGFSVAGFDLVRNFSRLTQCQAIDALVATGFLISGGRENILDNCHANGNETAGFQVDAGSTDNIIVHCSSGPADGARIDNGTNTSWPDFRITEVAVSDAQILSDFIDIKGTGFTSATHSLTAIRVRGDGFWITGGVGTGTTSYTITVTDATLLPIADVLIEVFTEESMQNKVVTGRTDNFGLVTFFLDAGSYYSRATKSGYSFVNPQTEVVE